jgi:hypothetical protein
LGVVVKNSSFGFLGAFILRVGKKSNVLFVRGLFNLSFSFSSKLSVVSVFLHLAVTVTCKFSARMRLIYFQHTTKYLALRNT